MEAATTKDRIRVTAKAEEELNNCIETIFKRAEIARQRLKERELLSS